MAKELEADERIRIPIMRDSTFFRFCADKTLIMTLGRDVDVGFLQISSVHQYQTEDGQSETFASEPAFAEVARMRMGFAEFLSMTMNFLREGIIDDRLKGDAIRKSIDQWIDEAKAASDVKYDG